MKSRNFGENFKNAAGTVFLLAAAFFVCSTVLSMRAVFADPIAPQVQNVGNAPQSTRAGTDDSRSTRTSPRSNSSTSRTGGATVTPSRTVSERNIVSRATSNTPVVSRNVVSRSATGNTSRTTAQQNRAVRSRTATTNTSRVSLTGSAIRGSKSTSATSSYTYLSSKLYTGNYSNIIDSTTGLISSEAYSNCMESYYACMDEICTARNAAQRRCACAGRVKSFADAESKLESANEELIKVSGELALLVATKGKDISSAFQLTDAEKVMNCVSYKDMAEIYKGGTDQDDNGIDDKKEWCYNHMIYEDACSLPSYCSASGNSFGFDVSNLDGSGSDILASLKSWADAKDKTLTITGSNNDSLTTALGTISSVVSDMSGLTDALSDTDVKDSLAETWGYELFEYAHNNVCNRVLDSCFNGIYEACGAPPSTARKCSNGSSSCPYNYNSMISVTNSGSYELNFVTGNTGYTTSNTATCFGYTSTSGDPYNTLRGPVADARRSVLQKYALDANADCDAYGDQLRTTAQNIGYQKVAAQQALQKKRLEFAQEETKTILADALAAGTNFNECIDEIYDCYTTQEASNPSWSTSRIKTYCAQLANVPSCYEDMICNPSGAQFKAIIDDLDSTSCNWSQDYTLNTCRNVVTLNEILTKAADIAATGLPDEGANGDSAAIREMCLQNAIGSGADTLREWTRTLP
ncbi:MAG: hypothetical protein JW974_01940 [Alphaproteobacteria bacterium]|nr:hypothetical protein [Alphaproteobacteria bacterium]MBN2675541.1 hypothetical protein [Alphaproteobacteria bacterium]